MLDSNILRKTAMPLRINPAAFRIDLARLAEFRRTRVARVAQLLGRLTPLTTYDLETPWLTLRPDQPMVPGKGYLEYRDPTFIGMGQFDEGERAYAAFELIFQKQEPSSYSIERPQLVVRLTDPPKEKMLIELEIHAHDEGPTDPKFEIWAANQQTVTVTDGQRQEIMFVMNDFFSIQSAWADGKDFFDRDGNWAFFEARITPLE